MEVIQIEGGHRVTGEVNVEGAKNSALKLMAATIMAPGVTTLTNVPNIADVHVMGKVLKNIGARIEVVNEHELRIDTSDVDSWETPYHLVAQMRASTAVLGPLLSRFGRAIVAMPGGCNIGARSIDMHILGLEALGVEFSVKHGNIHASAPHGLVGNTVTLSFASVGATENIMLASVKAEGKTVIRNAAKEPEIVDLQNFINRMGGKVRGAGSATIVIEGVKKLRGVEYTPIPDRIEAGTFLIACAMCGGSVSLKNARADNLDALLHKLCEISCKIRAIDDKIDIECRERFAAKLIETTPYPGFPTDLQAPMTALACICEGSTVVVENLFETRFKHVPELIRMGADITVRGRSAFIRGVKKLRGADVCAGDLRGGAALTLAAVAAEGLSTVTDLSHIDRGYSAFEYKLRGLGARIRRVRI